MKRIVLFASVAGLLTLGSCHKDWVCKCTDQDGNTTNYDQRDQTLSQARSQCKARDFDQNILGIHTSNSCALR
jgi:hypothetical protein